jgi:hypothetical protein
MKSIDETVATILSESSDVSDLAFKPDFFMVQDFQKKLTEVSKLSQSAMSKRLTWEDFVQTLPVEAHTMAAAFEQQWMKSEAERYESNSNSAHMRTR